MNPEQEGTRRAKRRGEIARREARATVVSIVHVILYSAAVVLLLNVGAFLVFLIAD